MRMLTNPIAIFLDARGALLDGGYIALGVANGDPDVNPIVAYWDSALTIVAAQPLRTIGGRIVNGAIPARIYFAEDDASIRIRDSDGSLVDYSPTYFEQGISYQPLDSDLTAIANQGTTSFGRSLLNIANQSGLQAAVGYTAFTGGLVTSTITRQGAGAHTYWNDSGMTSGRLFISAQSAGDPTSLPGDVWFFY